MKIKTIFTLIVFYLFPIAYTFSQGAINICNNFESNINLIYLDNLGIWEIGEPDKAIFNSSYQGANSIVTDLDSCYAVNDTSVFYAVLKSPIEGIGIPQHFGSYLPFSLNFKHRFITDSVSDFGSIEMSLDNGITWYDILSNDYNANYFALFNSHFFEGTGETQFDSLKIFGNSNGWVHSTFAKNILSLILDDNIKNPDSLIVKFSFISDSYDGNEGWQIDNICLSLVPVNSISENPFSNSLTVYPNPSNGTFLIPTINKRDQLSIYNLLGEKIYSSTKVDNIISTNLSPGIYFIALHQDKKILTTKIIVE